MWLWVPVGHSLVGQVGAVRVVGVLEHVEGFLESSGAEVDGHHRFDVEPPAPGHELVDAELVGLEAVPGQVAADGSVLLGADAVLPAVAGKEVAAGVTHGGDPEFTDEFGHVAPETIGVRGGVSRLVDPGVDAPSHVLDEGTEGPSVDGAHRPSRVCCEGGVQHVCHSLSWSMGHIDGRGW